MNLWQVGLASACSFYITGEDIADALTRAKAIVPMETIGMISFHSEMPRIKGADYLTSTSVIEADPGKEIMP